MPLGPRALAQDGESFVSHVAVGPGALEHRSGSRLIRCCCSLASTYASGEAAVMRS